MSALFPQPLCPPFSLAVDNILIPENRAHLSPEAQLKELLEKLDLVSAMRSSGARTRRVRMLRREINVLRQKLAQPPPPQLLSLNKTVPNGDVPAGSRGDAGAAVLDQALQEEPEDEGNRGERVSGRQGAGWRGSQEGKRLKSLGSILRAVQRFGEVRVRSPAVPRQAVPPDASCVPAR